MLSFATSTVSPIQPIDHLAPKKVALGQILFFDPRLSKNNTTSCESCHHLASGGAESSAVSTQFDGSKGTRNAPTVYNAALNYVQFWDGRALTLEDQILQLMQAKKEMGLSPQALITKLQTQTDYPQRFKKAYPKQGLTLKTLLNAIATFEQSLTTPNSRFDQFLAGNPNALTPIEQQGYQLFKNNGCISCHQGRNLGGNMYEKIGAINNYYQQHSDQDLGRFVLNQSSKSKHEFRVPSLRNVALTAPYFHNGSAKTLNQAIETMAFYQLGKTFSKENIDKISAFLKTLTGKHPLLSPKGKNHAS